MRTSAAPDFARARAGTQRRTLKRRRAASVMVRLLLPLLVGLLAFGHAAPRSADAHPHTVAPPIIVKLHLLDDSYKVAVVIERELWRILAPVPEGGSLWDVKRFEDWFHKACEIKVDDEVLRFEGKSMKALLMLLDPTGPASPPSGIAVLRRPRVQDPTLISIRWLDFDHIQWEEEIQVPIDISRGLDSDVALLTPEESLFLWHSSEHKPRAHLLPVPQVEPSTPTIERRPGWKLPAASLAAFLLALLAALGLRRARPQVRAGFLGGGIAAAALLYGVGNVEIGGSEVAVAPKPPSEARAMELFERLHQNIYTAFEVRDEDEIYDRLSVSARGPVLDALYADVYQSLILREENGAVAVVEAVESTSRAVEIDPAKPHEFDVVWGWNMIGKVTHLGHMHRRKNIYKAAYTVRRHGDVWHIVSMDVLEYARDNLDPPPQEKRKPPADSADDEGKQR